MYYFVKINNKKTASYQIYYNELFKKTYINFQHFNFRILKFNLLKEKKVLAFLIDFEYFINFYFIYKLITL